MARAKTLNYVCENCGTSYSKWQGQCHECQEWNTVSEVSAPRSRAGSDAVKLSEFEPSQSLDKKTSNIKFLDRLLNGGVPGGTAILLAGEPGIGKSTVLFQMAAAQQDSTLYVSAEESVDQVARRFQSFQQTQEEKLFVLHENRIELILKQIDRINPKTVVIDSIQMILSENEMRAKGGVATLREVTEVLVSKAKAMGFVLWIVGHVNKDGDVAGPKTLEHLVDTVLVFSMGEDSRVRILQTQKHRFGPSGEIALLEIDEHGLKEQDEVDSYWLRARSKEISGCAISPVLMGSRVFCVEVQALVVKSYFPSPRRSTSGFDLNRLHLLLAVLEKKLKLPFSQYDVYLNVVGGIKISDPGADLAVAAALISAYSEKAVDMDQVFCGEIGLTGELRTVTAMSDRMKTASQMNKKLWTGAPLKRPPTNLKSNFQIKNFERVDDALRSVIN